MASAQFEKGSGVVNKYGRLQIKGGQLVDKKGDAVYLKGMSFFWSMWTPDYWTADNVRTLARDWKVSILRAAVGVTEHSQDDVRGNPQLNYRLLETVVDACIEEDIYVIIDWHDHEAHLHKPEAKAFFEKYGKMYGHKEHILWETWNEPNAASSGISWWQHCKPYHEEIVPIIRKHSDNVIILGSPDWSRKVDDAARDPVRGENLAYALHFYTNYHKQDIRNVADWALRNGIAIFVSEWGLWNSACTDVPCDISYLDNADEGDRWMDWCDRNKVSWIAWAIYDKGETPAITKEHLVLRDSALTPAGKYYKRKMLS